MDTVTAILSAIVAKDPNTSINIEKIREDHEAIAKRQGPLSESGILKYAEQYYSSWKKNSGEKFWDANVDIIDWTTDYSSNSSEPVVQKTEKKVTETPTFNRYNIDKDRERICRRDGAMPDAV